MQRPAHLTLQRIINHLVLLDPRLAAKGFRHDCRGIMIAVAGEIVDRDPRVGKTSLISRSMSWAAMAIFDVSSYSSRPSLAAVHEARQPALMGDPQRVQRKWRFAGKFQGIALSPFRQSGQECQPLRASCKMRAACSGAAQPHSAPGPRRTKPRGPGDLSGAAISSTPRPPASAISATATRRPPSETSCTAATAAVPDQGPDKIAGAALGVEIDRRRCAFVLPVTQAPDRATGRDGRSRARSESAHRRRASTRCVAIAATSGISPMPPMAGVGGMATPLVSL